MIIDLGNLLVNLDHVDSFILNLDGSVDINWNNKTTTTYRNEKIDILSEILDQISGKRG